VRLGEPDADRAGVPNPKPRSWSTRTAWCAPDVRSDYQAWLDPGLIVEALAKLLLIGLRSGGVA